MVVATAALVMMLAWFLMLCPPCPMYVNALTTSFLQSCVWKLIRRSVLVIWSLLMCISLSGELGWMRIWPMMLVVGANVTILDGVYVYHAVASIALPSVLCSELLWYPH
jgi:hypothetical protein